MNHFTLALLKTNMAPETDPTPGNPRFLELGNQHSLGWMLAFRVYTPENEHGTWKPIICKGKSSSKPWLLGSMLVFWGVYLCDLEVGKNPRHPKSYLVSKYLEPLRAEPPEMFGGSSHTDPHVRYDWMSRERKASHVCWGLSRVRPSKFNSARPLNSYQPNRQKS